MTEQKISYSSDHTRIRIKVQNLRDSMHRSAGSLLDSSPFYAGGVRFKLEIFPNGESLEHEGCVSVFLVNEGVETVNVDFKFEMNSKQRKFSDCLLKPSKSRGVSLYDHPDNRKYRRLSNKEFDEMMEIYCSIRREWRNPRELLPETGVVARDDHVDKSTKNEMRRRFNDMEITMNLKFIELELMMKKFAQSVESSGLNNNISRPLCPGCFTSFSPGSKIAQCHLGHLICWTCWRPNSQCLTCSHPVTGRAEGMETYLRELFNYQSIFDTHQPPLSSTPKRLRLTDSSVDQS